MVNNISPRCSKQQTDTNDLINKNSLEIIQDNSKLLLETWNNAKKNILFVVHDNLIGGVELHVKDMIDELCANYNCFLLFKEEQSLLLTAYSNKETIQFIFHLNEDYGHMVFTIPEYKKVIRDILIGFKIDLVHVHHTLGHTLDIFYEALKYKIPVAITLHDFYYLCPTLNLLDVNLKYCKGTLDEERCLNCLHSKLGSTEKSLKEWRNEIQKILISVSRIFVPNQTVKEIYCEYYNKINQKISVIEHGVVFQKSAYKPKFDGKEALNIAFIGNLNPHKGSIIVQDLILENTDTSIKWHIFGWIGDTMLSQLNRDDLQKHGSYARNELVDLLSTHKIHLICILSILPETYCYTLTESIIAGIPVLVTDLGALGERVQASGTGWIVNYEAPATQILNKINTIKEDLNNYNEHVEAVNQCVIKNTHEMCDEYRKEYELLFKNNMIFKVDSQFDEQSIFIANRNMKHYLISQQLNLRDMLELLKENEDFDGQQIGVYIFGTGQGGQVLIEHSKSCDCYNNIKGFFDNNSMIWGKNLMNIPVFEPRKSMIQRQDIVIIASQSYADKMKLQLLNMGIPRDKIVYPGNLLRSLIRK